MATGFLCGAGAALLGRSPRLRLSILSEVKPPTGEPDAGEPPVRFGGRGDRDHSVLPTPTFLFNSTRNGKYAAQHASRFGWDS
jgi:hypothetical protein